MANKIISQLCLFLVSALFFHHATAQDGPYSLKRFRNLLSFVGNSPLLTPQSNLDRIRDVAFKMNTQFSKCSPNVCFALDGSGVVSLENYELQVETAQVLTAIIGGLAQVKFSAVQYGGILEFITRDEATRGKFQSDLGNSTLVGSPITFIAPALSFCSRQFATVGGTGGDGSTDEEVKQANRIVLLAVSMSSFLDDGLFGAVGLAERFRNEGNNKISALIVGKEPPGDDLFKRIVGDGKIIKTTDIDSLITGIGGIVDEICG